MEWQEKAVQLWDSRADEWSRNSLSLWETGSRRSILPLFTQFVHEGGRVLDAGCGDGVASLKLSQMGYEVTGVDISPVLLEKARERCGGEAVFHQADIAQLPFQDASFEAILCVNAVEWTPSPLQVLQDFRRVLRDNGLLLLGFLGPTAGPRGMGYRRLYGEVTPYNGVMPWEVERLALENGWRLLHDEGVSKREIVLDEVGHWPKELQQAVSFMWLFVLERV